MRAVMAIGLGLFSFGLWAAPINHCAQFERAVASGQTADQKLQKFMSVHWDYLMHEYPERATSVGYPGLNDRWTDESIAAYQRREQETRCALDTVKKIKRDKLAVKDRVNFDLYVYRLSRSVEGLAFPIEYMPVTHLDGVQVDAVETLQDMPASKVEDFANILTRLDQLPTVIDQQIALMQAGLKLKVTPVKMFLQQVPRQIDQLTTEKPEDSPLYMHFASLPKRIPPDEQNHLRQRAHEILLTRVYAAFHRLKEFLRSEYIPQARESIALSDLPNGKAWYAYMVRQSTTTNLSAEELHALGLKEVERITAEMEKVRIQVGFKGDLQAFNKYLQSDQKFFYSHPEDLLVGYRDIAKRLDVELPKLFKTLPRLPYGVRAIPEYQAKASSAARYTRGSLAAGRAGFFEANTSHLPSRPKWRMETLAMHEAVPGHHLQIAIQQEGPDLPPFRKYGGFTAFNEGWALYAESLGDEIGFYKDPYSKYGNLSAEMMRAVRLVVDTGIHAKGWSKEKALNYYRQQMPVTDEDSEVEINRYITWPGQALAYKVGELKIHELRAYSEARLADHFDVREFHDEVLGNGSLPMDVLDKTVRDWVSAEEKGILKKRL